MSKNRIRKKPGPVIVANFSSPPPNFSNRLEQRLIVGRHGVPEDTSKKLIVEGILQEKKGAG